MLQTQREQIQRREYDLNSLKIFITDKRENVIELNKKLGIGSQITEKDLKEKEIELLELKNNYEAKKE
jgi:hypothetical protein